MATHSPMRDDDHDDETCTLHLNVSAANMDLAVEAAAAIVEWLEDLGKRDDAEVRIGGGDEGKHWWITTSTDWAEHFVVRGRESEYVHTPDEPLPPYDDLATPKHKSTPDKPFDQEV